MSYLHARLAQVDTEAVGVFAVVLNEILEIPKRRSPRDEETALV